MKTLLLFTLTCFFATVSIAQLALWPLTSNINGIGSPGITVHPVAFGSGYTGSLLYDFGSVGSSCSCLNGLRIRNWRVTGSPSLNASTAVTQNRYVEFSFTNNTGSNIDVTSFDIEANAGFSNCTGTSPYSYMRWMIDGIHGSPQWIRNPSVCGAEQSYTFNNICYSYSRPNSANCGASGWTLSNPAVLADGQRIRFRIYIATNYSETLWRLVLGNVEVNGISALAVTLNDFNANCESNGVDVNWSTSSEQNASHFDLERSRDNQDWQKIATIPASGNSTSLNSYSYLDPVRSATTNYYRLRQVDFDGAEEIHRSIAVDCDASENSFAIFPNPSTGEFAVEINSSKVLAGASVAVYDLTGKQIIRKDIDNKLKGTNVIYFTENNLSSGTYLVVIDSGEAENSFKPVKLVIH